MEAKKMEPQIVGEKKRFSYYTENDDALLQALPFVSVNGILPDIAYLRPDQMQVHKVIDPNESYSFLHEAAIIAYHGELFASWYNCPTLELQGRTPIRGMRSHDGGKTWTDLQVIADAEDGKILFCPPVYGICEDKLYLLLNEMVAPDHIHALNLYCWNPNAERFEKCWSRPIPFKLNTNVVILPNGKRMLPGRVGELDAFPNTPAVLLSDDGKIDTQWRLVKIAENGDLPCGLHLVHPEISAVVDQNEITMFCRDDMSHVPLLYRSADCGEHWSAVCAHDLPLAATKIYAGKLSDGRAYLVANIGTDRQKLALFLAPVGSTVYTRAYLLLDETDTQFGTVTAWHYPAVTEDEENLYIILTANYSNGRGAVVISIPVSAL